jgi:hypothetical protein
LSVGPPVAGPSHLADALQSETATGSSASGSAPNRRPPAKLRAAKKRRTPEIIVYARIYNFAPTNEFDALADYALSRLKQRLVYEYKSQRAMFPDFDTVVRLIYRHCQQFDDPDSRYSAMLYLAEFTVGNFRLLDRDRFEHLMRDVGQFAVDVAWGLSDALVVQEQEVSRLNIAAGDRSPVTMLFERVKRTLMKMKKRTREAFYRGQV